MSIIILLLGIGSSGKSTVAKALQQRMDEIYQIVGFDYAVLSLDKKYWPGGVSEREGFYISNATTEQGKIQELKIGPVGKQFLDNMIADIINMANQGENLIVDTVLSENEYKHLKNAFINKHRILAIGLKPPLEIVIARENKRANRRPGTAKVAYHKFYDNKAFDLLIDTYKTTADESARLIHELIYNLKTI